MGEHADDQIAADMRAAARRAGVEFGDDDDDLAFSAEGRAERQEQRRGQLAAANAEMAATTAALAKLGLTLERQRSEYHVHILRIEGRRRTLVAQWWPSTGTAMDAAGKRQRCSTGKALVAWLRDKQRAEVDRAR